MKNTEILQRINALLSRQVKLEQQTLDNGTVVEADSFTVGTPIFAIDGENKTPLEIGEYVLADGSSLYVTEIGIIGEIAAAQSETLVEAEAETLSEETIETVETELTAVPPTLEEIVAAVVEALKPEMEMMKADLLACKGMQTEMKATLSTTVAKKPLTHIPLENKNKLDLKINDVQARIFAKLSTNKN
jgi:hypothetical protein